MKLGTMVLTVCLAAAAVVTVKDASCADEASRTPARPEAEAAAAKWLAGLGDKGLVLNEQEKKDGFVASRGPSAVGPVTSFTYQKAGWRVKFTFRGEINADTPLKQLQERFWHAVLDQVPTPGLALPGWEIRPMTPVSSIERGVEVLAFGDGKLKLRVRTNFFSLYGRNPSVPVPADAPAPASAYFMIRKGFPLDLTIEAPVLFK